MADDKADDVQASEITPEDLDSDEQVVAKAEPSPAKAEEGKPDKAEKPEAKGKEEAKGDDTLAKPDIPAEDKPDEAEKPEGESEDKPPRKAEERKNQLNTEIRDLVSQRNALRTEVEKANAEVYQPATEDELVQDGMSATDAKVEALRQSIEMKNYNDRVADAQLTLSSESERVLKDFTIFNAESDDYDKELATEAAELLEANLIYDQNTGQVIGSNVSPYQLYKTLARASGISVTKGQLKGQQDTETMLANADTPASVAPEKKKEDPLTALWSEEL